MTDAERRRAIEAAANHVRRARILLHLAGAKRATDAARRALKSIDGARRHEQLRPYREERQRRKH